MGDGCARDWGAGTSIGGKKMSLHEKGDQTRALNHNSDFSARFRVDFPNSQTFANLKSPTKRFPSDAKSAVMNGRQNQITCNRGVGVQGVQRPEQAEQSSSFSRFSSRCLALTVSRAGIGRR